METPHQRVTRAKSGRVTFWSRRHIKALLGLATLEMDGARARQLPQDVAADFYASEVLTRRGHGRFAITEVGRQLCEDLEETLIQPDGSPRADIDLADLIAYSDGKPHVLRPFVLQRIIFS